MPRFSVLIPTHEHAATLPYAVASVQNQGVQDIEILICGDGVDDTVRQVVAKLQADDARIRFFDLPKAPRIGELNRAHVLSQAAGEIVCYQNDDDLWLPGHLDDVAQALRDADFAGAMQVSVDPAGKVRAYYFDLELSEFVRPWLDWVPNDFGTWTSNGFGAAFAAHRLEAYRRLPEGWSTTPPGLPADQTMWHKFLRQPWCRARFLRWPIALHFPAPDRRDWSAERRAAELQHWQTIIAGPDGAARIWRDVIPDMGDRVLRSMLDERRKWQDMLAQERRQRARVEQQVVLQEQRLELEARWREEAQRGRAVAERELAQLVSSRSWRMTAPVRAAMHWLKGLRSPRGA